MDQQPQDMHGGDGSSTQQVKLVVIVQLRYKKYVNAYFLLFFILHYNFGLILNIELIIFLPQTSVVQEKGKEKVVHEDEEPHDEPDEFIIDFVSTIDLVVAVQKVLCSMGSRLM